MHIYLLALFYVLIVDGVFDLVTSLVIVSSAGFYGMFGFLVNDYFDLPYDIKSKKKREIHGLSRTSLVVIILVVILVSLLHLVYLQNLRYTLVYLLSFTLGFFYSAPPLRFKSRGLSGIIVNGLIEKTLIVLAIFAFFNHFGIDTAVFVLASFIIHLSDIITHQIYDYKSDLETDTKTFVVNLGLNRSMNIYRKLICPLSAISIIAILVLISLRITETIIIALLVFSAYLIAYRYMVIGRVSREEEVFPLYLSPFFLLVHNVLPPFLALFLFLEHYEYLPLLLFAVVSQYYVIKYKIIKPIIDRFIPHYDVFD